MELSISTIVIVVIAMVMLSLGLILVRNLMSGAIWTSKSLTQNIKDEIDKTFQTEGKDILMVGPSDRKLGICPGTEAYVHYWLATKSGGKITLVLKKEDSINTNKCYGVEEAITTQLSVPPTKVYGVNDISKTDTILINVPDNAPADCEFYLTINVRWADGSEDSDSILTSIKKKGIMGCRND